MKKIILFVIMSGVFLCNHSNLFSQNLADLLQNLKNQLQELNGNLQNITYEPGTDTLKQKIDDLIIKIDKSKRRRALFQILLEELQALPSLPPREAENILILSDAEMSEQEEIKKDFSELLQKIDKNANSDQLRSLFLEKLQKASMQPSYSDEERPLPPIPERPLPPIPVEDERPLPPIPIDEEIVLPEQTPRIEEEIISEEEAIDNKQEVVDQEKAAGNQKDAAIQDIIRKKLEERRRAIEEDEEEEEEKEDEETGQEWEF